MKPNPERMGIKLTPLDIRVLREIEDYGYRTYPELRESVLNACGRQWSWGLLKRLVRAGLIREVIGQNGRLGGWSPEKESRQILAGQACASKVTRGKSPKYASSFHHDRELRWTLDQFKILPSVDGIVTDSKLKADLFKGMRGQSRRETNRLLSFIPDARFSLKRNGVKYHVALELELTQKSHDRIRSKLENYIAKTNYSIILYVCGSDKLRLLIKHHYKWVLANSPTVKFAKRKAKIYCCLSDDLKRDFVKANFSCLTDDFSLEEIRP